MTGSNRSI